MTQQLKWYRIQRVTGLPVEGAVERSTYFWQDFYMREADWDRRFPSEPWRSKGSDHRTREIKVHDGLTLTSIERKMVRPAQCIQAESIEDLCRRFGELIVNVDDIDELTHVTIYDDYME
jgi:hypothetical protein